MKINHDPIFDTDKIAKTYSEKDGVPVSYVCTTDLGVSDRPLDIFYRSTPHPKFHNRYFGIYNKNFGIYRESNYEGGLIITNADGVESYEFGHDYQEVDGKAVDGGRVYIRGNGFEIYTIVDGKFVPKN